MAATVIPLLALAVIAYVLWIALRATSPATPPEVLAMGLDPQGTPRELARLNGLPDIDARTTAICFELLEKSIH